MQNFTRGEPYPFPVPKQDGAEANFLTTSGSLLRIRVNSMTAAEEKALRAGPMKAGLPPADYWVD